jgi:hypothetical protein
VQSERDEKEQREARSFKFPMLEYIFNRHTENCTKAITENHTFTLKAFSTGDDLNLEKMLGGLRTIQGKLPGLESFHWAYK